MQVKYLNNWVKTMFKIEPRNCPFKGQSEFGYCQNPDCSNVAHCPCLVVGDYRYCDEGVANMSDRDHLERILACEDIEFAGNSAKAVHDVKCTGAFGKALRMERSLIDLIVYVRKRTTDKLIAVRYNESGYRAVFEITRESVERDLERAKRKVADIEKILKDSE